jgi:hypothetical protein
MPRLTSAFSTRSVAALNLWLEDIEVPLLMQYCLGPIACDPYCTTWTRTIARKGDRELPSLSLIFKNMF